MPGVVPVGVVVGRVGKAYSSGLFDCCQDFGICCLGLWPFGCNQYLHGRVAGHSGVGEQCQVFGIFCLCDALGTACSVIGRIESLGVGVVGQLSFFPEIFTCCYYARLRTAMRNKYGLVGTFCECCECCRCCSNCTGCRTKEEFDDLCVSFWCRPCAVCQDARMLVANNITAPGMDQHMLAPGAQQFAY